MEASFSIAVDWLLRFEGGFADDLNDSGGATAFGVSARFLNENKLLRYDLNGNGVVDADDMRHFTKIDAIDIYRRFWWDQNNYHLLTNNDIAKRVFDFAVNAGQVTAIKTLQVCINRLNKEVREHQLVVDGIFGRKTAEVANTFGKISVSTQTLLKCFADERYNYYQSLIAGRPQLKKFEKGWNKRAYA